MRFPCFAASALIVIIGVATRAQDRPSPLDAATTLRLPTSLPVCGINTAVATLPERSHVATGFEGTRDCWAKFPRIDITYDESGSTKMTVRQLLDQLMTFAPDYEWREMDGVAVIRPVSAWMEAGDPLNRQLAPFHVAEATVTQTLARILKWPASTPRPASSARFDAPAFAMAFNGGTTVEALNELVRARGGSGWDATVWHASGEDGIPTLVVTIRTFNFRHRAGPHGALSMSAPIVAAARR